MAKREIGVGLLGLGNVGAGVVKILKENAESIEARLGARVVVRKAAVREVGKERLVPVDRSILTTDVEAVIGDEKADILVELIGGEEPAREYCLKAMERKKSVVTANKLLLALHGDELFPAAEKAGVDLYFEAAVCGGLPIIRTLREGMASDRIDELHGIINGTSNFILSTMSEESRAFDEVLREAQRAGFAEADPTLDVGGGDAAHKLAILMMLSFGTRVRFEDLYVEGITGLQPIDFEYADKFGYVIKPLAIAKNHADGLEGRVHPAFVPKRWMLSTVHGVYNALYVSSYALGKSMYYGRGAGMMPTAMAVVSDLIDVARNRLAHAEGGGAGRVSFRHWADRPVLEMGRLRSKYYLRFSVLDRPGVLAQIAGTIGEHEISIAQVIQEGKRDPNRPVTIVVLTHLASEKNVQLALKQIDKLSSVVEKTRLVRIVE